MKKMAVFASGTGSNAQKIIDHFSDRNKGAEVALIVCNKAGAGVLQIAVKENIPSIVIDKEMFLKGDALVQDLKSCEIDKLCLPKACGHFY